jgi:hypothetical protein
MKEALQWYKAVLDKPGASPAVARNYAWLLFARGERPDVEEAVQVIQRYIPEGFRRDTPLAHMVADLGPEGWERAEKICDAMTGEPAESCIYFRCNVYYYLGLKERAREVLLQFSPHFDDLPPGYVAIHRDQFDLFRNPNPSLAQKILERHHLSKTNSAMLHLNLANIRFGEHDRAGAFQHLKESVNAHDPYYHGFSAARAYLTRMNKDPNWPWWITEKK